ncbi:4-oxalocrotonate tautomerase family protein [Streptomyces sp. wa22]|uniref:tautomerase family protein n=1 Tax=Streptomyces sp. wa22 TaxID=1828244 RepID=UPI002905C55D|nr:4-oxalocrotonate tautomerase family protein [Streptomyces sp. wa22]
MGRCAGPRPPSGSPRAEELPVPVISVDWWKGNDRARRQELVGELTACVSRIAGCPEAAVTVIVRDVDPDHWGKGGLLADEPVPGPADRLPRLREMRTVPPSPRNVPRPMRLFRPPRRTPGDRSHDCVRRTRVLRSESSAPRLSDARAGG